MHSAQGLLNFWIEEVGPKGWYIGGKDLDQTITERYYDLWREAQKDGHLGWTSTPTGMLALLILLDQFPRNMFRNDPRAFSTDRLALQIAQKAIDLGWDKRHSEPQRQFFYLPLMHSECLGDQERCIRLMLARMPQSGADNLLHARAHREVIRRFGRFPHRNDDLGRPTTPDEAAFLDAGGYRSIVEDLSVAA